MSMSLYLVPWVKVTYLRSCRATAITGSNLGQGAGAILINAESMNDLTRWQEIPVAVGKRKGGLG